MHVPGARLKDFYQTELAALRSEAMVFADQHPDVARALGINRGPAADPQVELLMQSFAFLTGRLQHQIELDEASLPNALLAFLYPHLEAPLPSMLIADISVKPDGANFAKEQILPRNRYISASAVDNLGHKIECRFRTCYDTPLLPLTVDSIEIMPANKYDFLKPDADAHTVLRVRLRADGAGKLKADGPQRLRFYVNNAEPNAFYLYEAITLHLHSMAIHVDTPPTGQPAFRPVDIGALRWLGAGENEAVLGENPHTHPGYRLLQEYFAFPEKFMFFEVDQLDFTGAQDCFDLLLVLDAPLAPEILFTPPVLRLNCVPLINLFSQRIDPITLDHTEYEYKLMGDRDNHRYCEIYALESLESIRQDGSPRPIAPYFAMDDFQRLEQQDYFYVARRERSQGANIAGSEIFVSFLDSQFDLTQLVDEVIGGRALCTNRRLPEQILAGGAMYLEGPGPVAKIVALTKPTPHQISSEIGTRPWSLVSQLALNHLSLADGPQAMTALKDILRLHVGPLKTQGMKQIDGLLSLRCQPITRHIHKDGWRGFVRGHRVHLDMDRHQFEGASPVLFCAVLRHFFTLYATVNNLIEVSLDTQDIKGNPDKWQPLAGARPVL